MGYCGNSISVQGIGSRRRKNERISFIGSGPRPRLAHLPPPGVGGGSPAQCRIRHPFIPGDQSLTSVVRTAKTTAREDTA